MSKPYIHYAWHLSYFSGKSRAYLRYKDIPFVEKAIDFFTFMYKAKKHTDAAVMPVIVDPSGQWLQDTSVIIDTLEQRFPKSPVIPATPVQKFASYLMELWGDEWWLVIAMFTRWRHPENYPLFLNDAGKGLMPWMPRFIQDKFGAKAANQMRGHLPSIGVGPQTDAQLDAWTRAALDLLDAHFAQHPYLFGTRPSLGDFGLIGPMYAHLARDPWSKRELIEPRKHLAAWVQRMQHPEPLSGEFLPDDEIPATLKPVFAMIAREMLPMLEGILREVEIAIPKREAGKPLPRGLGEIEFPLGNGNYRRLALPYILWMVQRMLGIYREMPVADQQKVRRWLLEFGGERLLDMKIPRLKRVGLRVAAETAAA